jgi:predicted ester cyclase
MNNTSTVDPRVATVRQFVARVFNGHEPELVREYMTPDIAWHGNTVGEISGVDTLVAVLSGFIGALPDIHAEEQDIIASGDLVALRQVVSATQTGDLLGIPNSGRRVQWNAVDIYRVTEDGKISEQWAFEDMAAIGSQLGAFTLPWAS